jgi:hypothetical protein
MSGQKIKDTGKLKNEDVTRRTFGSGILVGVVISLLLVGIAALFGNQVVNGIQRLIQPHTTETFIVPFSKLEATWTTHIYSGEVTLTLSGVGQAGGVDYSDAFYLYTENGEPRQQPKTHDFDLEIDGQRAIITLGLEDNPPPFNTDHVYVVTYDLGEMSRRIAFRQTDLYTSDNSGEYQIKVEGFTGNG